jgi:hypothetical protein
MPVHSMPVAAAPNSESSDGIGWMRTPFPSHPDFPRLRYTERDIFQTPSDTSRLWCYLDLSEFLWLLQARALYFARVTEFDDKWEGKLPKSFSEGLIPDTVDRQLVETKDTIGRNLGTRNLGPK